MRRRVLMEGDENLKYGYFDVSYKGYESGTSQISESDFSIEIETGLSEVPNQIFCACIDDYLNVAKQGTLYFVGNKLSNGYFVGGKSNGSSENVSFLSQSAQYCRYENGTINIHVNQWGWISLGKWMWIAI